MIDGEVILRTMMETMQAQYERVGQDQLAREIRLPGAYIDALADAFAWTNAKPNGPVTQIDSDFGKIRLIRAD